MSDFKAKMHLIRFPLGREEERWERGGDGRGEEGREEVKMKEGWKRMGSSHAFCFSNLGSSVS